MASTKPHSDTPVGVIGSDDYGPAIAARIAACGHRVLYAGLTGSPAVARGQRLELASTPTDVAFECPVVLVAVDDTEAMRNLLVGNPDRMGMGAEMEPGSVIVDLGARTPRELQALLGLLGTRGVALVDAALIGGSDAAAEGRAKIMLGGYPDSVEIADKVLSLRAYVQVAPESLPLSQKRFIIGVSSTDGAIHTQAETTFEVPEAK